MRTPTTGLPFSLLRLGALFLLLLSLVVYVTATADAQQAPGKKVPAKEEEELPKAKQKGGKGKEEVEDPAKGKTKAPIRVGDEDLESLPGAGTRAADVDLAQEAERAKNSAVRQLFRAIAKPHDVVRSQSSVAQTGERESPVEPIPVFIGSRPQNLKESQLKVTPLGARPGVVTVISRRELISVDPYENIVITHVDDFLKKDLDKRPETDREHLGRLEMLQEAEKALAATVSFHDSARQTGKREGDAWNELERRLRDRLQQVQLEQLRVLSDRKEWATAFALANSLADRYPKNETVQKEIVKLLAVSADEAYQSENFAEARRRLNLLESRFPNRPEIESVRTALRNKAEALKEQAKILAQEGKNNEAERVLRSANSIYPLSSVRDLQLQINRKYPILRVGVREVPENLSPATAVTDAEKRAVELVFEGLVRPGYTPDGYQRFEPALAQDLPGQEPLGRDFQISPGATWSDPSGLLIKANGGHRPVFAVEVRRTIELLKDPTWPHHRTELINLMDPARVEESASRVSLSMKQGYIDPLALMSFKILPQELQKATDKEFAHRPVGSGPFQFAGRENDAVFIANPYYESRPNKIGLPRIREIRFVKSTNPARELSDTATPVQLELDLTSKQAHELDSLKATAEVKTLPNRRIYFLAVNHRKAALQNQALRRALAYGINREKILEDRFRHGHKKWHRPLNGPFPPGSWACKEGDPPDPFDVSLARAQMKQLSAGSPVKLTLKYPTDDPAVAQACEDLKAQLAPVGIELEPQGLAPADLKNEVEKLQNFDLAYTYWDYTSEAFWLLPLVDSQENREDGWNYMGINDAELEGMLRRLTAYREPSEVWKLAYQVHDVFNQKMPFIPLWQLDTHVAIHNSLQIPGKIDPLLIFTNVEKWSLEPKP